MKDGGQAFPMPPARILPGGDIAFADPGMTLRDYFAGQALAGLCADNDTTDKYAVAAVTGLCWELADAMLEARGEI